ncbi:glycoside hydrolase family 54 protein [Mycena metata]|uniref:Alpha-L-arabinofuranosidase n=1 Tax=Mycena metata TaxID=1033252 RepID=A0AAD7I629_9AGAR|nr:glycoside hydrolase family 54 protein [Mycena metata]
MPAAQDLFCASTTCLITTIFDQTGRSNHLTQAPPGGFNGPDVGGFDNLAAADGAPVTLNGQKAYGVFVSPGTGYRNDATNGIATVILDGTHFNNGCCFDYGNAETSAHDTGNGHMEAIYFGTETTWGTGSGNGPWIMADLENGLFSGGTTGLNSADPTQTSRFITAGTWAIRGANAASGALSTFYSGARPNVAGTFYEGIMTSGYPTDATENSVQANVVAAKYATTSLVSGPAVTVGSAISLRVTTPGFNTRFIAHTGTQVNTQVVTSSNTTAVKQSASWTVVTGLGNSGCVSFESRDTANSFIRHSSFALLRVLNGQGNSLRAWGYPTRSFRHFNDVLFVASNGGVDTFDATASYNDDVSFVIGAAFA